VFRSPQEAPVSGEPQPEDMSLTLTQSRMSGLDSLTGSGLAREAQAVAANFQIQVPVHAVGTIREDLNSRVQLV